MERQILEIKFDVDIRLTLYIMKYVIAQTKNDVRQKTL